MSSSVDHLSRVASLEAEIHRLEDKLKHARERVWREHRRWAMEHAAGMSTDQRLHLRAVIQAVERLYDEDDDPFTKKPIPQGAHGFCIWLDGRCQHCGMPEEG